MKWEAPKLITLVYQHAYGQCISGTGPGAVGCQAGTSAGGGGRGGGCQNGTSAGRPGRARACRTGTGPT